MSISVVKCSLVKCSEVLQCNDGTSNKLSNIIRRHIDIGSCCYMYFAIINSLIFFRFLYKYMVVFLFNTAIYVFLLEEAMYSYCCLCILCILIVVYVFILLSMYSWTRLP